MEKIALEVPPYGKIETPPGIPTGGILDTGTNLINLILNLLFLAGIVLAIIFIIFSGIQWVLSSGDKQKLQAARGRLTFAIIGLLIIAASFFIVNTVISLLGGTPRSFLNLPLPPFTGPDFPPGT